MESRVARPLEVAATVDPLIGRTIAGKLEIEDLIASGAMGRVYRARHQRLGKAVCVKVMRAELAADPTFAERFQREALTASRLDHPGSVRVLDFGEEAGVGLYLVMEFLDGVDLYALLATEGPPDRVRSVDIVAQILDVLAAAHDEGIIHRDIKPENVMILRGPQGEDRVKVCDFGIAKVVGAEPGAGGDPKQSHRRLTVRGLVMGTPEYMSPVQARAGTLDARSVL